MSKTIVIWNHQKLRIWRVRGSKVDLQRDTEIRSVEDCIEVLDGMLGELSGTRLCFLIDQPELDHHIERIPRLPSKLRKQLLNQRQDKLYGDEEREWVAHPMSLEQNNGQGVYLLCSLPRKLVQSINVWSEKNGLQFGGVFSLPLAVAMAGGGPSQEGEAVIHLENLGDSGYLIARDRSGAPLFFNRLDESYSNGENIEGAARRLSLFIEQEFSMNPRILPLERSIVAANETSLLRRLSRFKLGSNLRLIAAPDRRRLWRKTARQRAFGVLALTLLLTVYTTLPLLEKRRSLELELVALDRDIRFEQHQTQLAEVQKQKFRIFSIVEAFSLGRETADPDGVVPSALLVITSGIANALPDFVELDSYEVSIDLSDAVALFTMEGRPLTANLNLPERVEGMYLRLKNQGWSISEPELVFIDSFKGSRLSNQRGGLRKFSLSFKVSPKSSDF